MPGGFSLWGVTLPSLPDTMMINHKKKALTFGEFNASVCDACGRQKAEGIVRLAVNAHLVEFRGHDRFVILEPGPDKIFSFL